MFKGTINFHVVHQSTAANCKQNFAIFSDTVTESELRVRVNFRIRPELMINHKICYTQTWNSVGFLQVRSQTETITRAVFIVFGIIGAGCRCLESLGVFGAARHRIPGGG